jgi:hypothetical protein
MLAALEASRAAENDRGKRERYAAVDVRDLQQAVFDGASISRFAADIRMSLGNEMGQHRRMGSKDTLLEAARITVARAIRSRFAPGPERDRNLEWLARLGPDNPAPLPSGGEPARPAAEEPPGPR